MPTVSQSDLQGLVKGIFTAAKSNDAEAGLVSEYLVRANLCGVDSHGVIRVPDYMQAVEEGSLKPNVTPKVVRDRGAVARIDAGFGYGQVSAKAGMELAIKKAREYGTGTVAIFNCNHAGRIADYPLLAAQNDMIGIMMVKAYGDLVAPWGGKGKLLATSPLSFAVPAKTSRR